MANTPRPIRMQILNSLRAALPDPASLNGIPSRPGRPKTTYLEELDKIAARRFRDNQAGAVSVSGRALPLVYKLISTLIAPPHRYAVLVVDVDGRFDPTCLTCDNDDGDSQGDNAVRHVYVQRPARASPEHLRALVADAEAFMLYDASARPSRARPWWGTIVVGGGGLGVGDVVAAWKGWLRVDRAEVPSFALGITADEALAQREARQDAVDAAGWAATSPWGSFVFHE
ncbi:hypothetical protein HIM_08142 [Hirsutella minnesotensis 3608]|uniref:Uncharacterized protein n=1 Tax=Hirsutella minnesotensis 3608 TaxID=1043627 RepID=A0A0F7ZT45_9HYPO|nr:hypothetical protein HIM_08142 [Hirsutella minnesotensis 3608]